jgi:5'-3' exonuclease
MIALIDGDLIAYRCAASCAKQGVLTEDLSIAQARANNLLVNIKQEVGATEHRVFLSGGENFRKTICPEYKANRVDQERPAYLEPLREWLVVNWGATVTDGIEADDALGIAQTKANNVLNGNPLYSGPTKQTVICSLDKDLKQIPGYHFSWEIVGTGSTGKQWKKEAALSYVTEHEGLFNFYWQLVMGDRADNVPGYDGKMRNVVPKFMEMYQSELRDLGTEMDMFEYVYDLYNGDLDRMLINGQCLYVLRHEEDNWLNNIQPFLSALGIKA